MAHDDKFPMIRSFCRDQPLGKYSANPHRWSWTRSLKSKSPWLGRNLYVRYNARQDLLIIRDEEGLPHAYDYPFYDYRREEFSHDQENEAIAYLRSIL